MAILRRSPQDGRILTVRDVTVQKANRDLIVRQATHDALTGLPNRRLFHDRLEMTLRQARRGGELVGVAFLDVDRFKTVIGCTLSVVFRHFRPCRGSQRCQ
jgi:GGDEF domain-containing protein